MNRLKFRAWNGDTMNYSIMAGKFGAFWINAGKNNDVVTILIIIQTIALKSLVTFMKTLNLFRNGHKVAGNGKTLGVRAGNQRTTDCIANKF